MSPVHEPQGGRRVRLAGRAAVIGSSPLLRSRLRRRPGATIAALALAIAALAVGLVVASQPGASRVEAAEPSPHASLSSAPLRPTFGRSGLVTNEFAYWHPTAPGRHVSPYWLVTSGSLFAASGRGWTGVPDRVKPNASSSNGTDSAVFRMITRRTGFRDVRVEFELLVQRHVVSAETPRRSYDGVAVWLRYASETNLYALSVMRWDHLLVIKRKTTGGPSNGGTYQTLASTRRAIPPGRWTRISVEAVNRRQGVELAISVGGEPILKVVDTAAGSLGRGGRIGIRGDNTEFEFRDFQAIPLA